MTVTETSRTSRQRNQERSSPNGDLLALDTPVVSLHLHRPHMPRMPRMPQMKMRQMAEGSRQETARAVETARTFLPPPERMLYYGALGALAVFGLVEWPVAAAIGVGTMVAQRGRRGEGQGTEEAARPSARTETAASRTTGTTGRTTRTPSRTTRAGTTSARTSRTTGTSGTTRSRAAGGTSRTAAGRSSGTSGAAGTSGTSNTTTARSTSASK